MKIAILAALLLGWTQDPEEAAKTVREIREKVAPSVVAIEIVRKSDDEGEGGSGAAGAHKDYYNRPAGPATGLVLSADGHILTSSFNVSGEILSMTVITPDGKRHEAKRLGWDARLDVALIKIDAKDLKSLPRARIEEAKQGDFVCVIGRSPDAATPTVNLGILSAINRHENTAVQTDAEINYGNSGGPLVNLQGELLGVVSHVRPRAAWGQSGGVGFATKMAEIDKVLENLKKGQEGGPKIAKGPWIGIIPGQTPDGFKGVLVDQILPGSPAEDAGLDAGDLITEIDGKPVDGPEAFRTELFKKAAGLERELTIRRPSGDGKSWSDKKLKVKPVLSQD